LTAQTQKLSFDGSSLGRILDGSNLGRQTTSLFESLILVTIVETRKNYPVDGY